MAGLVVLAFFITTTLSVTEAEANKYKVSARRDGPVDAEEPCVPGHFSRGPGCGKCFCTAEQKNICSPPGTCQMDDKVPTTQELIHIVNQVELYLLPSLPNTGAACSPGVSYRVDCNRCLCTETKSLVCELLLCPSYDEDNERQASKMSGNPCNEGDKINKECVECSCDNGKYACKAQSDCISSVALLKLQRGTAKSQGCLPGSYPNPNGGPPCICDNFMLKCPHNKKLTKTGKPRSKSRPRVTLKGKMRMSRPRGKTGKIGKAIPFDEAFLDPNSGKKCTPNVIYRKECNNCFCTKERQLRCTVRVCVGAKGQEVLKKMRLSLQKQNE